MQLRAVDDDCEACRALGAEVCPECAAVLAGTSSTPGPRTAGAALPPGHSDLTLRQASVVLQHVRRFAPDAFNDALAYADEYLGTRT